MLAMQLPHQNGRREQETRVDVEVSHLGRLTFTGPDWCRDIPLNEFLQAVGVPRALAMEAERAAGYAQAVRILTGQWPVNDEEDT